MCGVNLPSYHGRTLVQTIYGGGGGRLKMGKGRQNRKYNIGNGRHYWRFENSQ